MVFETLGAVNEQGEEVLRQLFTFAAKQLGREFSSYCSRAWARISCSLQRCVAQTILNRIDGKPNEPELPSESFEVARVDVPEAGQSLKVLSAHPLKVLEQRPLSKVVEPLRLESKSVPPVVQDSSIGLGLDSSVSRTSIGIGPSLSKLVGCPQIPPFPPRIVSERSDGMGREN